MNFKTNTIVDIVKTNSTATTETTKNLETTETTPDKTNKRQKIICELLAAKTQRQETFFELQKREEHFGSLQRQMENNEKFLLEQIDLKQREHDELKTNFEVLKKDLEGAKEDNVQLIRKANEIQSKHVKRVADLVHKNNILNAHLLQLQKSISNVDTSKESNRCQCDCAGMNNLFTFVCTI